MTPSPTGAPTTAGETAWPGRSSTRPVECGGRGVADHVGRQVAREGWPSVQQSGQSLPQPHRTPISTCSPLQPGRGWGSPTPLKSPPRISPGRVSRAVSPPGPHWLIHSFNKLSLCTVCVGGGLDGRGPGSQGVSSVGRTDSNQATKQTN